MPGKGTPARAIRLADVVWERSGDRARAEGRDRTEIIRRALENYIASVELWEDNAGGLYLVAAGVSHDLAGAATRGGFVRDAAGWRDGDWDPGDELTTITDWSERIAAQENTVAVGDQTKHVATWTPSGLILHERSGGAASVYLGIEID